MLHELGRGPRDAGLRDGVCSHSHRHEILGGMSLDEQISELSLSRAILERELGRKIEVLAYPVGKMHCVNKQTVTAMKHTGYIAGFSCYGGLNYPRYEDKFDIKRYSADAEGIDLFRLLTVTRTLLDVSF